jgi:hypothetical protein
METHRRNQLLIVEKRPVELKSVANIRVLPKQ